MKQNPSLFPKRLIPFFEMLAGCALTAASFGMILIPQGFAAGGVTGLAKVLQSILPLSLSGIVFVLNMLLLLIGLLFVGKVFVAKTVAVSVLFPFFLELFSRFPLRGLEEDPLVSTLTAGVLLGIGAGLVIRSGASAGGFDTLAVVLNRRFSISVAAVMNFCDVAVILLQAMHYPILNAAYGIIAISISAFLVKRVITLGSDAQRPGMRVHTG